MIEEIDQDENVNLVTISKQGEAHETTEHRMESNVDFSTASSQNDDDEQTFAETLVNIKRSAEKDKARQEQELDESEEVVAKSSQAYDIDWSDSVMIRYHAIQNRSFSKAKVRKNMCMYLKNQGGYKQSYFKGLIYKDIRPVFERQVEEEIVQKEDVIAEQVVKERLKIKALIVREDKDKRQKKQDDLEKLTLMEYVEVISDSEEIINVTPLAVKFPIVGWKSYCKEDVGYYEIHMADGSYKSYIFFSQMLNDFDKEDLIGLYRLFSEKYASTRPSFDDLMLWEDMKIMFEPDEDDVVWKNHHSQELIEWRLYDSYGVHSLMLEEVSIHMLVEKNYPLPQDTITRMLRWKLHVNYNITEMTYELLRLIRSQLNQ
ncbi:hypothetical protein Tco_1190725 [Tanacetum coccineum]